MGKSSNITLRAADGFECAAYVSEPSGAPKGAIVVLQEIFGVNSHIRGVADGYAAAGYLAVAPSTFDRIERDVQLGYSPEDVASGAIFAAVWVQERNIADPGVLEAIAAECGLDGRRAEQAQSQAVQERYDDYTRQAIEAKVFGAPSYVVDGEIFWGQDRLDFVEQALRKQA